MPFPTLSVQISHRPGQALSLFRNPSGLGRARPSQISPGTATYPFAVEMGVQIGSGWYSDPWHPDQLRYWDGASWTGHVAFRIDPAGAVSSGVSDATLVEPEWHDLAPNRPGQSAREKAIAARRAAPFRAFLGRLLRVHTEERAWRVGADGEERVAHRLERLGEGWHVIHAVPVGEKGSDIDHVVIGPPGVFTINTKNHPGGRVWVHDHAFKVNGRSTPYLRNSMHEAARAANLLSEACGFAVLVEPVIVVLTAELTIEAQPVGVQVVSSRRIDRWLLVRSARLGKEAVEAIYEQARRDVTWRSGPPKKWRPKEVGE